MKRKKKKKSYLKFRVFLVLAFFIGAYSLIFMRAFELQVVESESLKQRAAKQHVRSVNLRSKRGDIFDRNFKELAISIDVDSVYARPSMIKSKRSVARALAPITGVKASVIRQSLASERGFVWVKRQIDLDESEREKISAMEGVGLVKESRRYYPNKGLASNLLGFTGVDSNGLEGIEHSYNRYLSGKTLKISGGRDARGRLLLFGDTGNVVPVEGMSVELTIDKTIQYVTESALQSAIDRTGAKGGTAVVLSPATGEVLAMATAPGFDLNNFRRTSPGLWRNRTVTDAFEPGSVAKVFVVAGAIEEGIVKPDDIFFCENGRYRVADRVLHDHEKNAWLSVANIIKHSSNIGAAKIAEKMGKETLYRYFRAFGMGAKTGLDLPGETSGSLLDLEKWSGVTLQTLSFGQGVSVSSIQLATALGAIANGGFLMKPYIVKEVKSATGHVVKANNPVILRRVVSAATARSVRQMMRGVTGPDGTGSKAALAGFEVAGKTGTAQKPDFEHGGYRSGAYVSSFFGFVPAEDPALTIIITLDEPQNGHYGGEVAAPVFKEIAGKSLAYLGLTPEQMEQVRVKGSKASPEAAGKAKENGLTLQRGITPDFTGLTMRKAMRISREGSIEVQMEGHGLAFRQSPGAGSPLKDDRVVRVWFQ
ncbi:MAG: penicillin-binding transpeptidase domain-containing protein [Thermodesulfobacteriota bacterium]